jgi:lysylphosphatidylglycerol synthetase-like protein (DUF2156 family)
MASNTISPQVEAVLYFIGLVFVYLASWSPTAVGTPTEVRTIFTVLGAGIIIVKYELSTLPKPQIPTTQSVYSLVALILSVVGGQISANYSSYWYAGLIVAIIGAILAAYEDLGGSVPTVVATATPAAAP